MLQKYRMGKWSKAGNRECVLDFDASGVEALRIGKFAGRVSEMVPERIA
jgi:hypothetical protein